MNRDSPSTFKWHLATDQIRSDLKSCSIFQIRLHYLDHHCLVEILNALLIKKYIDDSIISIFNQATAEGIPSNSISHGFHAVPGWNDYVEEYQKLARVVFNGVNPEKIHIIHIIIIGSMLVLLDLSAALDLLIQWITIIYFVFLRNM